MSTTVDDVLEILRSASHPLKAKEIALILTRSTGTRIPRKEVNRLLYSLSSRGAVGIDREFRWLLTEPHASHDRGEAQNPKPRNRRNPPQTFYDILQVSQTAHPRVIEKAYKTLAGLYHPDRATPEERKDFEERMKFINVAYETLSDEGRRRRYDEELRCSNA